MKVELKSFLKRCEVQGRRRGSKSTLEREERGFSSQEAQGFGLQEREVMPKQGLMETLDT